MDNSDVFLKDRSGLYDYYCKQYYELKFRSGYDETKDREFTKDHCRDAQSLYYENRKKYNGMNSDDPEKPYIFYWLTRTSFNGLIRYNAKGEFNAPFHVAGRLGITPAELKKVFDEWGNLIDNMAGRIIFLNESYDKVICNAYDGDVIYMDPPYENTKGMYFANGFDQMKMYDVIRTVENNGAKVLLSYDGFTGKNDRTAAVPKNIYEYHTYINNTRSAFKLLKSDSVGTSKYDDVKDSLYISYIPDIDMPKKLF